MRELFDQAFKDHSWGGSSPSGPGSSLDYTLSLREALPGLLRALNCKSMIDAPCGDTNWIKATDLTGIEYKGCDISHSLIEELRRSNPGGDFSYADITAHQLPKADFWLCRDVLFHISNADIYRVLFNFLKSDISYLGTTHHAQCSETVDCLSSPASWRTVNLTGAPFNLPAPLYTLWDSIEGFPARWLAVWSRAQLLDWMRHIQGVSSAFASFEAIPHGENVFAEPSETQQSESDFMASNFFLGPACEPGGKPLGTITAQDHGLYEFSLHGSRFKMLSLGDCQVTMAYLNRGVEGFEPFSLKVWAAIAADARLVLDIGAYTGIYSLLAFAANNHSTIVAFEASQTTFGRLMTNILLNHADGRICPVHKAVSNRSGHLDLALSGGIYTMASGESVETKAQASAWARKRVETIAADEIIIDWEHFYPSDLTLPIPHEGVSLVKMDVEGHEKMALAGMRRIIERDHPTMLVEVLEPGDLPDILSTLDGYEGFWVGERGSLSREHAGDGWNALLIHSSKASTKAQIETATGVAFPT